jgi:uncharacterized protein (DUF1501 family)
MNLGRRSFLKQSVLGLSAAALSSKAFLRSALAGAPGSTRNVIFVECFGGNDGMNTIVPWGHAAYYSEFRPKIGIPESQVLKVSGQTVGFHPSLAALKTHFDAGRVAVIQGVSYPNPSFSHEYSQKIWHSGSPGLAADGWLARYLNLFPTPAFPNVAEVMWNPTPFTAGTNGFVPNFTAIEDLHFPSDGGFDGDLAARKNAFSTIANALAGGGTKLGKIADDSKGLISLIDTFASIPEVNYVGQYPDSDFGRLLKEIVRVMNANLGVRFFHVGTDGFDTHSEQNVDSYHGELLTNVSDGIAALYADLAALGLAQDTLIVVFSEFGRTVYENGSVGTDHGTVNPVIVLGGSGVVGGFVNSHPPVDPSQLDPNWNELQTLVDFRDVFGTILRRWLALPQTDTDAVFLGHPVADLGFLA